jgi:sterol desaturase/sphingolipid hydroxylase (fatty acid hydroxylase superfamily)/creatinine amidohydrolase/Fe(II)-dependent formamide hydrolase-like protein
MGLDVYGIKFIGRTPNWELRRVYILDSTIFTILKKLCESVRGKGGDKYGTCFFLPFTIDSSQNDFHFDLQVNNMDDIWHQALENIDAFGDTNKRTYILYLFSALALSVGVYLFARNKDMLGSSADAPKSIKNFLRYMFPKDVYLHKSSQQDYAFFIVNAFIHYGIIASYALAAPFFVFIALALLTNIFGHTDGMLHDATNLQLAALTLCFALLYDFGAFFMHYLMHRIPFLWCFHKVHHSAERLNPMTLYRMHPVDLFLTGFVIAICTGLGMSLFIYFAKVDISYYELLGINAIFFAFYIFGYNLRHSHIWLPYPSWLSRILISPAQHQIHHSIERHHWDKNMGLIFAFWDWGFRTLYIPKKDEPHFAYGINKKEPNPYDSVSSMFIKPFIEAWHISCKGMSKARATVQLVILLGVLGFIYHVLFTAQSFQAMPKTLYLEDLTWSETAGAMHKGYDKIIIPTGGVEQNGRHLILGKHNYVIKETSQRIAKATGGTLIAPVINYVPEEVHMSYPGTISVSEETFAAILEDAARSLKRHGFKYIFFIGDSFGNQTPQSNVAEKLNLEWFGEGAIVASISDYYDANGQITWLEDKGYSMSEIGGHAGIRDTSEILAAHPKGYRKSPFTPSGFNGGDHNGNYKDASKKTGEAMIQLKVDAASKQINAIIAQEQP